MDWRCCPGSVRERSMIIVEGRPSKKIAECEELFGVELSPVYSVGQDTTTLEVFKWSAETPRNVEERIVEHLGERAWIEDRVLSERRVKWR